MILNKSIERRAERSNQWAFWFAWRRVPLLGGGSAWLCWVGRRLKDGKYEYLEIGM